MQRLTNDDKEWLRNDAREHLRELYGDVVDSYDIGCPTCVKADMQSSDWEVDATSPSGQVVGVRYTINAPTCGRV